MQLASTVLFTKPVQASEHTQSYMLMILLVSNITPEQSSRARAQSIRVQIIKLRLECIGSARAANILFIRRSVGRMNGIRINTVELPLTATNGLKSRSIILQLRSESARIQTGLHQPTNENRHGGIESHLIDKPTVENFVQKVVAVELKSPWFDDRILNISGFPSSKK